MPLLRPISRVCLLIKIPSDTWCCWRIPQGHGAEKIINFYYEKNGEVRAQGRCKRPAEILRIKSFYKFLSIERFLCGEKDLVRWHTSHGHHINVDLTLANRYFSKMNFDHSVDVWWNLPLLLLPLVIYISPPPLWVVASHAWHAHHT